MTQGRHRGFTLIELLVVVSIIAVLAGMLLPAISSVRKSAQQTRCASNIKQATMAIIAYTADWEGFIADSRDNWGRSLVDSGFIDRLAGLSDPSWRQDLTSVNAYVRLYGLELSGPDGWWPKSSPWSAVAPYGNYARINVLAPGVRPTSQVLLVDTVGQNASISVTFQQQCYVVAGERNRSTGWEGAYHLRHRGQANAAFLDGHVLGLKQTGLSDFLTEAGGGTRQDFRITDENLVNVLCD